MRKNTKKVDIIITAVIILLAAGSILFLLLSQNDRQGVNTVSADTDANGAHGFAESTIDPPAVPKYASIAELDKPGIKIGGGLGSTGLIAAEKTFKYADIIITNEAFASYEAVADGIYDAFVFDRRQMQLAIDNGLKGVTLIDEDLGDVSEISVGVSRAARVPDLRIKLNSFISEMKAAGILDDAFDRWSNEGNYEMPDIPKADAPGFTLRVGTTGIVEPYSFYKGKTLTGFDIEMARRFAAWLGADIEFKVYDYSGVIAAAESGDIDCIFADLMVTDERREAIDFSDPLFIMKNAIMVAAVSGGDTQGQVMSIESIVGSFEKNFIREERWRLIVDGIGTTCLITVLSTVFGSVLAFLICMFRRTGSRLANAVSNIYVKLLQGTPMVVLLMILYYVILGKSGLEAVWVAIIGFSLNFGAYASEIMRSGIESIDGGQREAALALGYSENQAFFRFIFPQASVRFLPVYNGEIVSLLKSTSIVGYIAIQDLTKMSDIIRSRTYEAFFPLIATAIIYFILAWIISLILKFILKKVSPRRKRG